MFGKHKFKVRQRVWQKVKELFSISATPERILELEDKLEKMEASLQLISCNGHLSGSALADIARIALKFKEPVTIFRHGE